MTTLTPENRKKLMRVSTATLTTALFKRGFRNLFIQDVRPLNPDVLIDDTDNTPAATGLTD